MQLDLMEFVTVSTLKLKIDVSGTVGDEAWRSLHHFEPVESVSVDNHIESSGPCKHPADAPHLEGECISARIHLETTLLAQYAVSHYLEQERVLDAEVED